jgi:uncharacterized protein YigE (DUF2233 family)
MSRWLVLTAALVFLTFNAASAQTVSDERMLAYSVDLKKQSVEFYWKDDSGALFGNFQRLKDWLGGRHRRLVFAMNGGMFKADRSPVGLFIQRDIVLAPLDTSSGEGNFYLKPNGVLYITREKKAVICSTGDFGGPAEWATQSGPMLLIKGAIHPRFTKGSSNVNIRNGVGVMADGRLLFAMSKTPINFYDLAEFFKEQGCQDALYLDGFVSRTWLPDKNWEQKDGDLGVMIAVTAPE